MICGGCATSQDFDPGSSGKKPGRVMMRTPDSYDTRAHPASFVVDRFEVPKAIQEPVDTPVPFYFKSCDRDVGTFVMTNSRYDCDYP